MASIDRKRLLNSSLRAVAVVGTALFVHAALKRAAGALARDEGWVDVAGATTLLVAGSLALSLAVRIYRSRPLPVPFVPIAALLAVLGVGYSQQLDAARAPGVPLPSIGFAPAGGTNQERHPTRPSVLYHYNQHGFRGPDWPLVPTGPRLCIVGDSYVFGSGVEWPDTLGELLGRRLGGTEVLNLGVPGHNMRSHVAMYGYAAGRLQCDHIVLALVLPNDLSRFDINSEIILRSTASAYSATAFLFGPELPARAWNTRELSHTTGPDELRELHTQWAALAAKRARHGATPLYVFAYVAGDPMAELTKLDGVTLLPGVPYDPTLYIPNDGHPNAKGNEFFAARLADTIKRAEDAKQVE